MPRSSLFIVVERGAPPADSYWTNCTRAELAERVSARRHQQSIPQEKHLTFDPSIAATAALAHRRLRRTVRQVLAGRMG